VTIKFAFLNSLTTSTLQQLNQALLQKETQYVADRPVPDNDDDDVHQFLLGITGFKKDIQQSRMPRDSLRAKVD